MLVLVLSLGIGFAAPSLDLVSLDSSRVLTVRIHGDDSFDYSIETSTNLSSWAETSSLRTTNGVALFATEPRAEDRLYVRVRESPVVPAIVLGPQSAAVYSAGSVVTPDGGSAQIVMPDLREITLTIPPGCVSSAQEFTMTVITNFTGLPFTGGMIGAVKIEPEDLSLAGVASLEITMPTKLPSTNYVVSFTANNDGTGFHIAMDLLGTNILGAKTVLIPVSRFATYGAGLASSSEIDSMIAAEGITPTAPAASSKKRAAAASTQCVDYGGDDSMGLSLFSDSSKTCFQAEVVRAIHVRSYLRTVRNCQINPKLAAAQLKAQANQQPERVAMAEVIATEICPFVKENVTPFWGEAADNCALGTVLADFTLSIERTVELMGITLESGCGLTLAENASNLCLSSRKCLEEIEACCLQGHKGLEKVHEVFSQVRPFFFLGDNSCYPGGPLNDDILKVARTCSTNAWDGTFTVTLTGAFETNYVAASSGNYLDTQQQSYTLVQKYDGWVYQSDEGLVVNPFIGGRALTMTIRGDASIQEHVVSRDDSQQRCGTNGTLHVLSTQISDTIGITNVTLLETKTNDVAFGPGVYLLAILLKTNDTYQISTSDPITLVSHFKRFSKTFASADEEDCVVPQNQAPTTSDQAAYVQYPAIYDPQIFPMPDTNSITGSYTFTQTNQVVRFDVPVTVKFDWNFRRFGH